jgi:hypothetical protein
MFLVYSAFRLRSVGRLEFHIDTYLVELIMNALRSAFAE